MKKPERPTPEQCTAEITMAAYDGVRMVLWHPQWGGYASPCVVRFSRVSGTSAGGPHAAAHAGCFDVMNWHDGEFPIPHDSDARPDQKHYCCARQVVDFGLSIYEAQIKFQIDDSGRPVSLDREWIDATIARLEKLRAAR